MKRCAWLCASVCAAWLLASSSTARAERVVYGIVIGHNAPPAAEADLAELRFADDDAARFYELLRRAGRDVHLLAELDARTQARFPGLAERARPPTLDALERAVSAVSARMQSDVAAGRDPVLFITFSGHGAITAEGEPYLALRDGMLTQSTLETELLPRLRHGRVHLIFDACNAGAMVGVRGGFEREASAEATTLTASEVSAIASTHALERFSNVGVIVATALGQEAHEWERVESGVFTHEVLSALLGGADVNGDLRIEYSEVQAFVAAANRDVADPRARPQVIARPPRADQRAVLIDLQALDDVVLLRGRAGFLGRFRAELENGVAWLEAHFAPDLEAVLALPRARTMFLRGAQAEAELDGAESTRFAALKLHPPQAVARGSIDTALRKQLYATAYGRAYYAGFVDSTGVLSVRFVEPAAPVQRHDGGPAASGSKPAAITALVAAGALLVAGGVAAGLAVDTKARLTEDTFMRRAHELADDYQRYMTISVACLAGAVTSGLTSFLLWPSAGATPDGRALQLELRATGRF